MTDKLTQTSASSALEKQLARVSPTLTPERDLWAGIDHAIEHQQPVAARRRGPWLAVAATVMVGVAVGWLTFTGPAPTPQMTLATLAKQMSEDFHAQRQTMLVSYGQQDYSALSQGMQTELAQLETGIAAVNRALEADPDNAELLELLGFLQQQVLDLLSRLYQPGWQTL